MTAFSPFSFLSARFDSICWVLFSLGRAVAILLLPVALLPAAAQGAVYDLTTELEATPLGLDGAQARVSWKLTPRLDPKTGKAVRGQQQSAYRLRVTSEGAVDKGKGRRQALWDSGKVESSEQILLPLQIDLEPGTRYYWTVRVWDENDRDLGESAPTWFETGLLEPEDWAPAKWIQSALRPAEDNRFEQWMRYAMFPMEPNIRMRKWNVAADEVERARAKLYNTAKDTIWSASLFRREFPVVAPVYRARLYISGLGYYRAYLNGEKIGERSLAPSDSHFFVKANYNVYDVTGHLDEGANALAVETVNGRWRAWLGQTPEQYHDRPVLISKLVIDYADGSREVIVTDESWQSGRGGIERHGFWNGELFDANTYPTGWMLPGFGAKGWVAAESATPREPIGELRRDVMPAEKLIDRGHPVSRKEPMPGVWVYDWGKQLAGRARFHFKNLKKGQVIVVRYAEVTAEQAEYVDTYLAYYDTFNNDRQHPGMLRFKRRGSTGAQTDHFMATGADGSPQRKRMDGGLAYCDMFISAGEPEEVWEPSFTYSGFRYLEILGLDEPLELDAIEGFDIRTAPERIGVMRTDNEKLNRVLQAVHDTILLCYHSQLQDNNGAERNPNLTNIGLNNLNVAYTWGAYPLWIKGLDDNVRMNEYIRWPANLVTGMRNTNDPSGKRYLLLADCYHYGQTPWDMVAFYADRSAIESFIPWQLTFLKEASEYTIWNNVTAYGDHTHESSLHNLRHLWGSEQRLPSQFIQAGMVLQNANLMIDLYEKLGLLEQAEAAQELRESCLSKAQERFYSRGHQQWVPDMISRQQVAVALQQMQFTPRPQLADAAATIVEDMRLRTDGHIITGSRLSDPILHVLSRGGQVDVACDILLREDYPSLLNMVSLSGNSLMESWRQNDSFAQIEGYTAMGNWFYRDLVGISPDPAYPGFKRFTLAPVVPTQIGSYDFDYESVRGKIVSHLETKADGTARWTVTVPPNASAVVTVPTDEPESLSESGFAPATRSGIRILPVEGKRPTLELLSGTYVFDFKLKH